MMFCHVSAQAFNLITLNMNQFSTFFTLARIAALIIRCLTLSYVLKAGTVCTFYHIFLNQTTFYHLFQLPVYCCRSDCNFTVFEVFSDFLYSNMLSLHGLQKSMLLSHLFYLISGFCHFDLSFSIWKSFLNYLH